MHYFLKFSISENVNDTVNNIIKAIQRPVLCVEVSTFITLTSIVFLVNSHFENSFYKIYKYHIPFREFNISEGAYIYVCAGYQLK